MAVSRLPAMERPNAYWLSRTCLKRLLAEPDVSQMCLNQDTYLGPGRGWGLSNVGGGSGMLIR